MALTKGFLHKQAQFVQKNLIFPGTLIGIHYAFAFYGLAFFCWEVFRYYNAQIDYVEVLVLPDEESLFFNFFFAMLSCMLGFWQGMKFIIENSISRINLVTRIAQRKWITLQNSFSWSFLLWGGKLGLMYAIVNTWMPLHYFLSLFYSYFYLFLLILLVLYMQLWIELVKHFKKGAYKWMFLIFAGMVILSTVIINFRFTDHSKLDAYFLDKKIYHKYKIVTPIAENSSFLMKRSLVEDLHIGFYKENFSEGPVIVSDENKRLSLDLVSDFLNERLLRYPFFEKDYVVINLHIDEDIPYGFVKKLKNEIRKTNIRSIQISTFPSLSPYPRKHIYHPYEGIRERLHPYWEKEEEIMKSELSLDEIIPQLIYSEKNITKYNRMKLNIDAKGQVFVNGSLMDNEQFFNLIFSFSKKYKNTAILLLQVDDLASLKDYVRIKDMVLGTVKLNREIFYKNRYNEDFKDNLYFANKKEQDRILFVKSLYPDILHEPTEFQWFLYGKMKEEKFGQH